MQLWKIQASQTTDYGQPQGVNTLLTDQSKAGIGQKLAPISAQISPYQGQLSQIRRKAKEKVGLGGFENKQKNAWRHKN